MIEANDVAKALDAAGVKLHSTVCVSIATELNRRAASSSESRESKALSDAAECDYCGDAACRGVRLFSRTICEGCGRNAILALSSGQPVVSVQGIADVLAKYDAIRAAWEQENRKHPPFGDDLVPLLAETNRLVIAADQLRERLAPKDQGASQEKCRMCGGSGFITLSNPTEHESGLSAPCLECRASESPVLGESLDAPKEEK